MKTIKEEYLSLWVFETVDSKGRKQDEIWFIRPLRNKRTETALARAQNKNTSLTSNRKLTMFIHVPVRSGKAVKNLEKIFTRIGASCKLPT